MRIAPIDYQTLNAEQRRLHDQITATRSSGLGGPMSVLVRTPHIGEPADDMHNAFRLNGKLDRRLFEMLVIMVAREHGAEFAWSVHERLGLRAGLSQETVDAIRERRTPRFTDDGEAVLYELVAELLKTSTLSDASYRRGLAAFDLDLMIEIVSAVGFYSMVSVVLNTFGVEAPESGRALADADGWGRRTS